MHAGIRFRPQLSLRACRGHGRGNGTGAGCQEFRRGGSDRVTYEADDRDGGPRCESRHERIPSHRAGRRRPAQAHALPASGRHQLRARNAAGAGAALLRQPGRLRPRTSAYPGGMAAFKAATVTKIEALGLKNTVLVEPTGLSADNRASAADMALVLRAAGTYPEIARITSSTGQRVRVGAREMEFRNTNALVGKPGWNILLSKTGFTNEAGRCLTMRLEFAGRKVLVVLMGAAGTAQRTRDAINVRRWLGGDEPVYAEATERASSNGRIGKSKVAKSGSSATPSRSPSLGFDAGLKGRSGPSQTSSLTFKSVRIALMRGQRCAKSTGRQAFVGTACSRLPESPRSAPLHRRCATRCALGARPDPPRSRHSNRRPSPLA